MNASTKWAKDFGLGLIFVILWSSASSVTKIGLLSNQPLVLAIARFAFASMLMLTIVHVFMGIPIPKNKQLWTNLIIYGILNVGVYLGLYVYAMREVSAGLGSLFIAINPVLILLMSSIWFGQKISSITIISFFLCIFGMLVAAFPHLTGSFASVNGLVLLFLSNVSYSMAAIYFAKKNWYNLHILAINGWQTLFGGLFLLPLAWFNYENSQNSFDANFWLSILWLGIPCSVFAVLIWLYMLKDNATKASVWLFLCPIVGFIIAAMMLNEPISKLTIVGLLMVLLGLYLVSKNKKPEIKH